MTGETRPVGILVLAIGALLLLAGTWILLLASNRTRARARQTAPRRPVPAGARARSDQITTPVDRDARPPARGTRIAPPDPEPPDRPERRAGPERATGPSERRERPTGPPERPQRPAGLTDRPGRTTEPDRPTGATEQRTGPAEPPGRTTG
ncbi:MAG: hypothetical protein V7637_2856, partial [Mycobacteriales bacterium]